MFDITAEQIKSSNLMKETMNQAKKVMQQFNPNAFYIALVEDTNDPYKLGRVKIRIPAVHGTNNTQSYYLPNSGLPWARPAVFNAGGNDMGQFIVPMKGNRVFVTFEYNDSSRPIYFGGVPTLHNKDKYYNDNFKIYDGEIQTIIDNDRIKDLQGESAQSVLFKSFKGATIIINDQDGKESIKIIDAAGQEIIMENDSEDPLPRRGDSENPPSTASITVKTNGKLTLKCDTLDIQANNTNISDYVN